MKGSQSAHCPRCGAPAVTTNDRGNAASAPTSCSYCGTPLPFSDEPSHPPPRKVASAKVGTVMFSLLGLTVLGSSLIAVRALTDVPPATPVLTSSKTSAALESSEILSPTPSSFSVAVDGPFLFDVDRDGHEDLLGTFERVSGESHAKEGQRWIAAVNGLTGAEIWRSSETPPHPAFEAGGTRALVGDLYVLASRAGDLLAIDAHRGHVAWSRALGKIVVDVCTTGNGLGLVFADGERTVLGPSGSAVAHDGQKPCGPVYSSRSGDAPNFSSVEGPSAAPLPPSLLDWQLRRTLVPTEGTARVLLGVAGGEGPSVAVVAEDKVLWKAAVAPTDMARSSFLLGQPAAVRRESIVVPYLQEGRAGVRVGCFELRTGKRTWDIRIDNESGGVGHVAVSRDGQVFFRGPSGRVHVLNLQDGSSRFVTGGPS